MARRIFLLVLVALAVVFCGAGGYLYWQSLQPRESVYDPLIASIARNDGVDPFLVRALIWRESRFDPTQHGQANEHGLMQVTPDVGQMWAKATRIENFKDDDLYDPETNIRAGTWYLKRALTHWSQTDDPVTFALAEYNAGRKKASTWVDPLAPQSHIAFLERITYPGTRAYIDKIESMREKYRDDFANDRWYREEAAASGSVTKAP